jgi:hypothetical protein
MYGGGRPSQLVRYVYGTGTAAVTTAWRVVATACRTDSKSVEIFDSSGCELLLGIGPAGSEVDLIQVFPGGNGHIPLLLNQNMRLSVRVAANSTPTSAATGVFVMNLYI